MLTAVGGTYDNGRIIWDDTPSIKGRKKVVVTFLDEDVINSETSKKTRRGGSMKGEVWMADDFNES